MTKGPAESLDNLDGQVSLETLVCLEIKEKEVIIHEEGGPRCRCFKKKNHFLTDEVVNVSFETCFLFNKGLPGEKGERGQAGNGVRGQRGPAGPQGRIWMLYLYLSRPLLHGGQEHSVFINLFRKEPLGQENTNEAGVYAQKRP